jgi:MFS family permease
MFALFLTIESRVRQPIIPLQIFRRRSLVVSNVIRALWALGISPWIFFATMYMQLVLGLTPLQVAFAFLPSNLIVAAFSLRISAALVRRFGVRTTLATGLLLGAAGMVVFARVPIDGQMLTDILPGMLLMGTGLGIALVPLFLATMSEVAAEEAGLASGLVNTTSMIAGAVGLAVFASLSAGHTRDLLETGLSDAVALTAGFRMTFLLGAGLAVVAAVTAFALPGNAEAMPRSQVGPEGDAVG